MRRREFITVIGATAVWPLAARAQQPAMPVIGYLSAGSANASLSTVPFLQGLKESGFVEGQDVNIEYRWAQGRNDLLPDLAHTLARREVAVIVAAGTPATLAAKAATQRIPIVFQIGIDPVELGLVASLNRPGGNLTGVVELNVEVAAKCLEVLREVVPAAASVALLVNPANPTNRAIAREIQAAAGKLGVNLSVLHAGSRSEIETAFETLVAQRTGALVVSADRSYFDQRDQLAALAARHALPAIYFDRAFAKAGGLLSYGTDLKDSARQTGVHAGRILRGEKPADLPVQQATKIELVLNLKTAEALGIAFPLTLLGRADEVIE
jgi:putative ABC transport system substrate-binding protein